MALPKSHFSFIFKLHSFTCVGVDMHMLWHVCGGVGVSKDSLQESIISFHYASTRIRLWLSGLAERAFNQWVISSVHFHFLLLFFLTSLSVCTYVYVSVCASVFVCAGTHLYGECVARIYVYVYVWVQTPACVRASCLFCPHASSFFETVSLIFVKLMFYRLWLASPFPQDSCLRFLVLGLEAYPSTSDFVPGSWRPKLRLSCLSSKVLYPLSHFSSPNKLF